MLRVLMIISSFSPIVGGAERQALLLANTLAKRGVKVVVLTRRQPRSAHTEVMEGIRVMRAGRHQAGRFWSVWSALLWLVAAWRLQESINVLHAHQPYSSALVAGAIGRLTAKPVVCKIPGEAAIDGLSGWRGSLLRRLVDRFVVVNSSSLTRVTEIVGQGRVEKIPNGIRLGQVPRVSAVKERKHRVLFVGRLEPVKGADLLLQAFPRIRSRFPTAELILVGDGSERRELEEQAQQMSLEGAVSFVGEIEPGAVSRYYTRAGVFVNTSRYEGISNAMLEAMLYRVPVVASRIPGNTDLVRDGETGLLFDPGDVDGLARAIIHVLGSPERAQHWADAAYEHVSENYDVERVADQYLALYQELLGGAGGQRS